MPSKDQGLTVGELTIAIAILIIAGLIWSNIRKNDEGDQSLSINSKVITLNHSHDMSVNRTSSLK